MDYGVLTHLADWMISMLGPYGPLVVYVSVFLLGENAILAASMLSFQGYVSPGTVITYSALGSLSADIFWYCVTVFLIKGIYEKKFLKGEQSEEKMFLLRMADTHTFWLLTFIKFLVGMRLFLTIYILLKKHIPFLQYLLINIIGTILFIGMLFPVGWLLGKGLAGALFIEKGIKGLISIIVAVIILANILPRIFAWGIERYAKKVEDTST